MTYSGWTNYCTWAVALWINNDEYAQGHVLALMAQHKDSWAAEDALKDFVTEEYLDTSLFSGSLAGDLLDSAISQVDWAELVSTFVEDLEDEDEDEDEDSDPEDEYTFQRDQAL